MGLSYSMSPPPKDYRVERCVKLFGMPDEKLVELWSLFLRYDRDKKGLIYMQDFLDWIIKSPKTPLTSSMLGLIESKHEGCMDYGEFVEVICTFCNFEQVELIRYVFYILDPYRTGRIEKNELNHFFQAIWNHDPPISLREAMDFLENQESEDTTIFNFRQIELISEKFPSLFYPVYKLQIHIIENTLGTYWWETHKAKMRDAKEAQKQRELEALEKKKKDEEEDDEAATMELLKKRMGIKYYIMPWLIPVELNKLNRILAIEKDLESKIAVKT